MLASQDNPHPHNHAQDKTDDEREQSRILQRTLAQIENSRWLVLVHCPHFDDAWAPPQAIKMRIEFCYFPAECVP